ncbi:MAG TPA: hypothetical protein VFS40_12860 [Gemmatimonadales bacterium]|nr:hypothetical protein [Gemmatimonadales bacterium]
MPQQMVREACLRPQFAELYPTLVPSVWLPATEVARRVFLYVVGAGVVGHLPERILSDAHFEFRGGRPRNVELAPGRRGAPLAVRAHPRVRAIER